MTTLDRRDRRRASKVWEDIHLAGYVSTSPPGARAIIAAALKREREETGMGAMKWFLFSSKPERAKVKRAIQAKKGKR